MARYPVKMLKDEQNQPFVPMVSAESIYTNDDKSFEEKFATKLEPTNLKGSDSITITKNGNDCTFEVDFGASDNIIDNLNTTVAGQGPLDARQGNVLKNMIPTIVDNLDSTDATKVLSANQGHELKEMSVPTGGATGQVLKKASNNDHELEWGDAADPNAIVGDGSIMKIIELTYAEYKTLESNGELKEDTEYHIIDVENGSASYITEEQIQTMIDNAIQLVPSFGSWQSFTFHNTAEFEAYTTSSSSGYSVPRYRKFGDCVMLKGLIEVVQSTTKSIAEVCKITDSSCMPKYKAYFTVASSTNEQPQGGKAVTLTLGTDGIIRVHSCDVTGWVSLDGIMLPLNN